MPELHDASSGAWSDYLAGRHAELLTGLPALMVDTRRAVHALADDHAAEAAGLLATSYRLAAGLSGRFGLVDLEHWGEVAEHLDAARILAPQWSRVQPLGYAVVSQLVEHRGRRTERITELAEHYGAG